MTGARGDVPRVVACDLDGTLLHPDGTVTERTGAALRAVEDRGVVVVFVTGRPLRWMSHLWQHVGEHGLAVCSNGALVYDVTAGAVRRTNPLTAGTVLRVADALREAVPGSTFAVERVDGIAWEPGFREEDPPPRADVGPLADLVAGTVVKLLVRHDALDPETFWSRVQERVGDLVTTTWSSTTALVEISAAGVTKASTLARLCEELGASAEQVWAFGDMPNDLPMLSWAGTSYAMANAHPSVRELADHVAPANADDGVAVVLEGLLARAQNSV